MSTPRCGIPAPEQVVITGTDGVPLPLLCDLPTGHLGPHHSALRPESDSGPDATDAAITWLDDDPADVTALAFVTDLYPPGDLRAADAMLAGTWWVPLHGVTACGAVAAVIAEDTHDAIPRKFVCDKPADHIGAGDLRHRHVTDRLRGRSTEWTTDQHLTNQP